MPILPAFDYRVRGLELWIATQWAGICLHAAFRLGL